MSTGPSPTIYRNKEKRAMNREKMLIEAEELLTKMEDPNLRIYDATILFFRKESDPTAYDQYVPRHIPGAAFFDHMQFSDPTSNYMYMRLAEAELAAAIGNIGISAQSEVIVYTSELMPCATRAWWLLRYAGHNNVRVLNGGIAAWEKTGGKIAQGGHQYETEPFVCHLRPEMFVDKDAVLTAMQDGVTCTINTLTSESYEQAHIQDSSLSPCSDLLQEMATFLPTEQIAARLQEEAKHERIITYCGGGIAATVNAMAHLMAGNVNVAVYDGSMDEWSKEGLPLTKGSNNA